MILSSLHQDVALVELSGSDSDSVGDDDSSDSSDDSDDSDSDDESKITEQNLKLPGHQNKKKKVNIQVLGQQGE